jgi:hypothetical protein
MRFDPSKRFIVPTSLAVALVGNGALFTACATPVHATDAAADAPPANCQTACAAMGSECVYTNVGPDGGYCGPGPMSVAMTSDGTACCCYC